MTLILPGRSESYGKRFATREAAEMDFADYILALLNLGSLYRTYGMRIYPTTQKVPPACPHEGSCNHWWNGRQCPFKSKCNFTYSCTSCGDVPIHNLRTCRLADVWQSQGGRIVPDPHISSGRQVITDCIQTLWTICFGSLWKLVHIDVFADEKNAQLPLFGLTIRESS